MSSARTPIRVEIQYVGDKINLVVPKQEGLSFEDAAPRLAALAQELAVDGREVEIVSEPERHLHGSKQPHQHVQGRVRAH